MGCHPELAGAKSLSGDWPSRARLKLGAACGKRETERNKSAGWHRKHSFIYILLQKLSEMKRWIIKRDCQSNDALSVLGWLLPPILYISITMKSLELRLFCRSD